jgi:phosphohistidine phosphatase SixA
MEDRSERHDLQLYLLRHAHAGDPDAWTGDDAVRPLSDKGRHQSERLAEFLAQRRFMPDAIVSSPKLRALDTARIVAQALGLEVSIDERLGDRLHLDRLADVLDEVSGRRIVLVGHDPDFSDLVSSLSGAAYVPLKKGALARVDVSLPLQEAGGILRWLLPPDLVALGD